MGKKVFTIVAILAMVWLLIGPQGNSTAAAQSVIPPVRLVRTLENEETGVSNPVGIAFSQLGNRYHLVGGYEQGQRLPAMLSVQQLDLLADPIGSTLLQAAVDNPMNIAFDNRSGRLLIYQSSSDSLLAVKQNADGNLLSTGQTAYDFSRFRLQSVQGLSFDEGSGALYILDSAAQRILRIKPDSRGSFANATAVETDLSALGTSGLRGLAVDPASGNLFVADPVKLQLYELNPNGDLVSQRDLSVLGVQNPQGMTFAPSGDQTDDPAEMSLYLADSGIAAEGSVLELSFSEIPSIEHFSFTPTLVATRDLSTISPPSPDAVGIAYHVDNGTLLISDSEVEEEVSSAYWYNVNVWELSLDASTVQSTGNTSFKEVVMKPFSDEPTDVAYNPTNKHYYFSDDNLDRIFDLNPGVDLTMWTGDDVVTSFPVAAGSTDPEGVAFGGGNLFVADGVNSEIYRYSLTGTLLGQFDTEALGVVNPNAVEYNALSSTLLVLYNNGAEVIAETTISGQLLRTIDVSAMPFVSPDGLTYAPPTNGDSVYHYYIADRGLDNNTDPTPDAKIFEITAPPPITTGNQPLIVNAGPDQNITLPTNQINLDGTVTDDGIPGSGVTSLWTVPSGACGVTFGDPSAVDTTATFIYGGLYALELEASDTELNAWDTLLVKVNRASPTTIFDAYVEAKWDDAEERVDGSIGREGTTIELGEHLTNGPQTDGFRFNWLDIPQGATITNAYIQFTAHDKDTAPASFLIKGEASDNASTFLNIDTDISSRPTTSASVAWTPSEWNTVNQRSLAQRTPNLSSILQEIVNRPGWQSGNSAAFIITGTGTRRAYGYEGNPCDAAMLHVEWEMGAPNNPPVVAGIPDQTIPEGQTFATIALDDYVTDVDNLDTEMTWTYSGNVALTVTIVNRVATIGIPNPDWHGAETITFRATDPGSLYGEDSAIFTVTNVNDPPVVAGIPDQTIPEGQTFATIALDDYVTDVDNLDTEMTWTYSGNVALTVTIVNRVATIGIPNPDWHGAETITFRATDPGSLYGEDSAIFTVTNVNDPPVVAGIPDQTIPEGQTFTTIALDDYVTDVDNLDTELTWTYSGNLDLTVSIENRVATIGIPNPDWYGAETITFRATDPGLLYGEDSATFTVTNVNDAPVLAGIPDQTILEGQTFTTIALDDYVTDVDNLDTELTWTYSGNLDLTVSIENRVATIGIPNADWYGAETITFRATDPGLLYGEDSATFTVTNVNDPPVAVDDSATVAEDSVDNVIDVLTNDTDADPGDVLTVTAVGTASHGTVTLTAGVVKYTPNTGFVGIDSFTYTVSDGLATDEGAVTIHVGTNHPPVAVADSYSVLTNRTLDVTAVDGVLKNDTDEDGHALTAIQVSPPSHAGTFTFNPDGSFTYTPAVGFFGVDTFTYKANDGLADSNIVTVTIYVRLPLYLPFIMR